jgi:hypothetical protein
LISKFFFEGYTPVPPFSREGEGREGEGRVRMEGAGKTTGEEGKGREMGRGKRGGGEEGIQKKEREGRGLWPPVGISWVRH